MSNPLCTIVVPCFNEAERLRTDMYSHFLDSAPDVKLLFVNDGSRDNTISVLKSLERKYPDRVKVLDNKINSGKAEAVRAGMLDSIALCDTDYTGFWDADLATPLEVIPEMISVIAGRSDIQMIFGARVRLLGRHIERQAARHYLGRCFATVVSMVLRLPIYDTQCGAKIFRITPELQQILADPFESRWIFDVEILARFLKLRGAEYASRSIYEYPLQKWEDVAGSKVSKSDFIKAIFQLFHIRRRFLS